MDAKPPAKSCPACGGGDYMFRSRKQIERKPGEEGPDKMETKFRCKSCGKEWKVVSEGRVGTPKPDG
jgi:transposase-like protein